MTYAIGRLRWLAILCTLISGCATVNGTGTNGATTSPCENQPDAASYKSYLEKKIGKWGEAAGFREAEAAFDGKDYETALASFSTLAKQGNAAAQFFLARIYYWGRGTAKDREKAVEWALIAAESDFSPAQIAVGFFYAEGCGGVPKDYKQAVYWLTKAAEQGDAIAVQLG